MGLFGKKDKADDKDEKKEKRKSFAGSSPTSSRKSIKSMPPMATSPIAQEKPKGPVGNGYSKELDLEEKISTTNELLIVHPPSSILLKHILRYIIIINTYA